MTPTQAEHAKQLRYCAMSGERHAGELRARADRIDAAARCDRQDARMTDGLPDDVNPSDTLDEIEAKKHNARDRELAFKRAQ
jgi:hypothetical protein